MKIKIGDNVTILNGKDRTKIGKVERIDRARGRVWVAGVNIVKLHLKPSKKNPQGGIIDKAGSMHLSNIMLICPHCQKPTRIKHLKIKGKSQRTCTHCKESINV